MFLSLRINNTSDIANSFNVRFMKIKLIIIEGISIFGDNCLFPWFGG